MKIPATVATLFLILGPCLSHADTFTKRDGVTICSHPDGASCFTSNLNRQFGVALYGFGGTGQTTHQGSATVWAVGDGSEAGFRIVITEYFLLPEPSYQGISFQPGTATYTFVSNLTYVQQGNVNPLDLDVSLGTIGCCLDLGEFTNGTSAESVTITLPGDQHDAYFVFYERYPTIADGTGQGLAGSEGRLSIQDSVTLDGYTLPPIDFTPVPEPSSVVMVSTGLACLGGVARRRFA